MADYSVYLVRRDDGNLYTGIATDVARRLADHESGRRGSKYLRGRQPLVLFYEQPIGTRSLASKIESRIKRLSRAEKEDRAELARRIAALLEELGPGSQ